MRRATITTISLLLITLAGYSQASGETWKWENFSRWEYRKRLWELDIERLKPQPEICLDLNKYSFAHEQKKS